MKKNSVILKQKFGMSRYSLLNATIGEVFDAFHAGYIPAKTLSPKESTQTLSKSSGTKMGGMRTGGPPPVGDVVVRISNTDTSNHSNSQTQADAPIMPINARLLQEIVRVFQHSSSHCFHGTYFTDSFCTESYRES